MRCVDLGRLDGPVLLFGGPYSNAQAMAALTQRARSMGIAPDQMICTGDVVAYCGDPAGTIAQIRALGCHVVAGNCEVQLATGASDCGCGFEEGSSCDILSLAWFNYASQHIAKEDKDWMNDLPDLVVFTHAGKRYGVLHGGVTDVSAFLWSTTHEDAFLAEWSAFEAIAGPVDAMIAGHCGIPFQRDTRRGAWINAGVIGMPPHDGTPQTCFALLDAGDLQMHRLTYDAQAAAEKMREAGLPDGYRLGLTTGYWPSEDVLPDALRVPSLANG